MDQPVNPRVEDDDQDQEATIRAAQEVELEEDFTSALETIVLFQRSFPDAPTPRGPVGGCLSPEQGEHSKQLRVYMEVYSAWALKFRHLHPSQTHSQRAIDQIAEMWNQWRRHAQVWGLAFRSKSPSSPRGARLQ